MWLRTSSLISTVWSPGGRKVLFNSIHNTIHPTINLMTSEDRGGCSRARSRSGKSFSGLPAGEALGGLAGSSASMKVASEACFYWNFSPFPPRLCTSHMGSRLGKLSKITRLKIYQKPGLTLFSWFYVKEN